MKKIVEQQLCVGLVVFSISGRDSGKTFVVTSIIDKQFVYIADGVTHKLNKPKRKSIKHLKTNGQVLTNIATKLSKSIKVFDSELRSNINELDGGHNV